MLVWFFHRLILNVDCLKKRIAWEVVINRLNEEHQNKMLFGGGRRKKLK